MFKRRVCFVRWAFLAACFASLSFSPLARADEKKNVLLIGWDGAQRAHVHEMIEQNQLPVLAALAKEGTMIDIDVISGATSTKAGWSQIITGYAPEKSGVYDNDRYQPIPKGYTIFERVESFLGPRNVETVAIIAKKGGLDAEGPQRIPFEQWQRKQKNGGRGKSGKLDLQGGKLVEENGVTYVDLPGKPWFHCRPQMDLWINNLKKNEIVGIRAMEELEKRKDSRFLFFVQFAEPDELGHEYGENSPEYNAGLKLNDLWTGKIIEKIKQLGLSEKTLVYVVTDHGFNEGDDDHKYAPHIFLVSNDKTLKRAGTRDDIAPTVLKRFGLDLSTLEPPLDGYPLDEPAPERKAPEKNPKKSKKPAKSE